MKNQRCIHQELQECFTYIVLQKIVQNKLRFPSKPKHVAAANYVATKYYDFCLDPLPSALYISDTNLIDANHLLSVAVHELRECVTPMDSLNDTDADNIKTVKSMKKLIKFIEKCLYKKFEPDYRIGG